MSSVMDDDIIEVKLSSGSIAALAKAMGGGGAKGGKGGGSLAGLGDLKKIGMKGMLKLSLIGLAITAIMGSIKAIAGSSPMLKQMFKLMNFGIMMIFRPIGDFIGFMLRPIIVLLLRNFIIPWYTYAMPILQSIGGFFGGRIAADLESFIANPSQAIADGLNSLGKWASDGINFLLSDAMDWAQLGKDLVAGVITIFTDWNPGYQFGLILRDAFKLMDWSSINSSWDQVGKNIRAAIGTWFQGGIDKIVGGAFFVYTAIKDWFTDKLDKLTIGAIFVYTAIKDWFTDKLDKLTIGATFVYTAIKDWFWNGLNSIETSWNDLWSWISDWIKSGINSITSGIGLGNILPFANGGQINEPIMGIGRSGQMYSFGENGSETVIPNGESGGSGITLNISVGNISSEGDMRNFETRVMDILENANSRRGRL
jgi:hypothetical protein